MDSSTFASQRIVQSATATLAATFPDQHGEPRVPGVVTVGVVRSDGTVIFAPGTATATNDDGNPTVVLSYVETSLLDVITCTWTETDGASVTTHVEVVGGHYFGLQEARTIDRTLQKLETFPDEDLFRVRGEVELELERITGRSFVPRFRTDRSDASLLRQGGKTALRLAEFDIRSIRWVKVNGITYASYYYELGTAGRLFVGNGVGLLPSQIANGPNRGNLPVEVTAGYEYGWNTPPDDLKRAMVARLRSRLVSDNSSIPQRATAWSVDGNTFSLSTPGRAGARTGIPDVDEVYQDYMRDDWKEDFVGSMRIV